jgi:restriction system protein
MKLKMSENSLFAILLRKPWWISILIAVAVGLAAGSLLPRDFAIYGATSGFPFLVIGVIAAVRQWGSLSSADIGKTIERAVAMPSGEFAKAVAAAYRKQGYDVVPHTGPGAEFDITKANRTSVVACKRWKAATTGIEPLRELHAAMLACEGREAIYLTTGQVSDAARRFAQEKQIRIVQSTELAQLLRDVV